VQSVGHSYRGRKAWPSINKRFEDQLKVHMIPQRLLKPRLVRRNFPILKVPNFQFFEDEIGPNSCLRSGVAIGISLGYLSDRSAQNRELREFVFIHGGQPCEFFEGRVTPQEGVVEVYEGNRTAGDRVQELRCVQVHGYMEHLERVTGLQQYPEGFLVVCQDK